MADLETSQDIDEKLPTGLPARPGTAYRRKKPTVERWLSGDPRRAGAFLRADALAMLSESAQALARDFTPQAFAPPPRPPSRPVPAQMAGVGGRAVWRLLLAAFGLGPGLRRHHHKARRGASGHAGGWIERDAQHQTSVKVRYTERNGASMCSMARPISPSSPIPTAPSRSMSPARI
jgi:transmembrane sensor